VSGRLRRWLFVLLALSAVVIAVELHAQRRFVNAQRARPEDFDGSFQFCRVMFNGGGRFGSSWNVDWPRADINLSIRLSELTKTRVGRTAGGEPRHVIVSLDDPELFNCSFIMMTEVGSVDFSPSEAEHLRDYLLKGGFLWADDFWGEYAWSAWENELRKVLPSGEFPIYDVPMDHLLFRTQYHITSIPQIPSITFWFGTGQTSERGGDSAIPHVRAINNAHGDIMVLMTHNTDFGDAFEREGEDRRYFDEFATVGYAFGVNVYLYAMTH
jgi:hypothetical protein